MATLSTGPVGLGDGAADTGGAISPNHGTNLSVILPAVDSNGTILKPSRPASAIDAMFGRGWNPGGDHRARWPSRGVIMQTHTALSSNQTLSKKTRHIESAKEHITSWLLLVIAANDTYDMSVTQLFPQLATRSPSSTFLTRRFGSTCTAGTDAVLSGCVSEWHPSRGGLALHTGPLAPDDHGT